MYLTGTVVKWAELARECLMASDDR